MPSAHIARCPRDYRFSPDRNILSEHLGCTAQNRGLRVSASPDLMEYRIKQGKPMIRNAQLIVAALILIGGASYLGFASAGTGGVEPAITSLPPGYRDWRLISVAHEEGKQNDLRAILGNDIAFKAARDGKLPYPDGAIIARLAWSYVASEENNKVFGQP